MRDKIIIACVGDSITFGFGTNHPESESYPAVLQELLGTKYQVENYGVNCATVLNTSDFPYTKTTKYFKSLESNADIIILMLGTNDAKPGNWVRHERDFIHDYITLLKQYRDLPSKPHIFIATSPTAWRNYGDWHDFCIIPELVDEKIVVLQREIAKEFGCDIIEIHEVTKELRDYFPDTIHPDINGYRILADYIHQGIMGYCSMQK